MQEITPLVSVVIPAYNAEKFIVDTIRSVKEQQYPSWELIVVNDGSKDATPILVAAETDPRIRLINQANAGVSTARNNGLAHANGKYIVFLDADDLFTPDFLSVRVDVLERDPSLGFTGGMVKTFPVETKDCKAVADDPQHEILFFDTTSSTVPSNYLVRRSVLDDYHIGFNPVLSSSADRFFLLQLATKTKGHAILREEGKLLYRISEQSMSHRINYSLISDNEKFYYELVKHNLLPQKQRGAFQCLYFFSLALGFGKIRRWRSFFNYGTRSFLASPIRFLRLLFRRLTAKRGQFSIG